MAKAYTDREIESLKRYGPVIDLRWLATVDELRAEIEQQREMFREMNEQRQSIIRENFQQEGEMDRLKADLDLANGQVSDLAPLVLEVDRLKAENARLRGALEFTRDNLSGVDADTDDDDGKFDASGFDIVCKQTVRGCIRKARAALKGDDDADNQDRRQVQAALLVRGMLRGAVARRCGASRAWMRGLDLRQLLRRISRSGRS